MKQLLNDLNQLDPIKYLCAIDSNLSKLISFIGPLNHSPPGDKFVFLVKQIIGQMLSLNAGRKIFERLHNICNGNISIETLNSLSDEELKSCGTSTAKVSCIRSLIQSIQTNQLKLDEFENMDDKEIIKNLSSIKGIGIWTSKMYLLCVLNRQDVLPLEDACFVNAYCWMYATKDRSKSSIINTCSKWSPYSSIASRYLFKSVEMGLTKTDFSSLS